MPFEPTYKVVPHKDGYAVMTTTPNGAEYICTLATPDRKRAEDWCRTLRGAARVETERTNDIRNGRRRPDDD